MELGPEPDPEIFISLRIQIWELKTPRYGDVPGPVTDNFNGRLREILVWLRHIYSDLNLITLCSFVSLRLIRIGHLKTECKLYVINKICENNNIYCCIIFPCPPLPIAVYLPRPKGQ
jgi:hypothetical protein